MLAIKTLFNILAGVKMSLPSVNCTLLVSPNHMKNNLSLLFLILSFCIAATSCVSTKAVVVSEPESAIADESIAASKEKSDRRSLQLKGAVKTIEIDPDETAPGLKKVYVFNQAGNILEESRVYPDDNRVYEKTVNSYDKTGRKIAAESFEDGKLEKKSTFKSDAAGNIVEQADYDASGKLLSKVIKKYDNKGNLIEITLQLIEPLGGGMFPIGMAAGNYKTVYSLDDNGNPKQTQNFVPGLTTPFVAQSYVYNSENQKTEEADVQTEIKGKEQRIMRDFLRYNKQGDVIETGNYESIKESNVEEVRDKFKVIDDKGTVQNGLLISDKPFMILWSVTVCEYIYDSQNNWTKKTCKWKMSQTKDFVPVDNSPLQRVISYY